MKKVNFCFLFLLVGFTQLFAGNRYEIKSGIVEYEIVGDNGKANGSINGSSKLIFKDFGNVELIDEKTTQIIAGEQETERTISKIVKDTLYTADFDDEMIYSQKLVLDEDNPVQNIKNRDTFTQMGAKYLGTETILGYKCDVWQLGENKIWVYNSVPLKQISKSLGVVQMQMAKSATFNIDIKDDKFKLPNFPVQKIEAIIGGGEDEAEYANPVKR
ncbi:hypothetical protein N5915_10715 [Arcobacter lacus]|uniref:DUF4412 domain-containing protein n=1 Tax=Arcobacter lacus TaxID=1912876 RepID=A0ABX5JIH1_9BACT|nr:hypothetical protein [Arcobacter lacus]MCT7910027.1 hypothetical protein [Arcobacter lacus]MCT7912181.1 hypothetical protein [Arcobacter lacus]PUE64890.1 hypothetical protein B0175_10835 [Arcobacter lacus]